MHWVRRVTGHSLGPGCTVGIHGMAFWSSASRLGFRRVDRVFPSSEPAYPYGGGRPIDWMDCASVFSPYSGVARSDGWTAPAVCFSAGPSWRRSRNWNGRYGAVWSSRAVVTSLREWPAHTGGCSNNSASPSSRVNADMLEKYAGR
jgi:hypothetical protein